MSLKPSNHADWVLTFHVDNPEKKLSAVNLMKYANAPQQGGRLSFAEACTLVSSMAAVTVALQPDKDQTSVDKEPVTRAKRWPVLFHRTAFMLRLQKGVAQHHSGACFEQCRRTCIACAEQDRVVRFGCGHSQFCQQCTLTFFATLGRKAQCPVCSVPVVEVIHNDDIGQEPTFRSKEHLHNHANLDSFVECLLESEDEELRKAAQLANAELHPDAQPSPAINAMPDPQHPLEEELVEAARSGQLAEVEDLLAQGAPVNSRELFGGGTALHEATENGHEDVVLCLLQHGARADECDYAGFRPLHVACDCGCIEAVRVLLDNGAALDARSRHCLYQPLHLACLNGHEDVARLLLERGADLRASNSHGSEPLHVAAYEGHLAVVQLLLQKGADVHALDHNRQRPVDFAEAAGHDGVADLLR